jgi:hypothetical protein
MLGDTLEKIAREKAGIMKAGVPCVSTRGQRDDALAALTSAPSSQLPPPPLFHSSPSISFVTSLSSGKGRSSGRVFPFRRHMLGCLPHSNACPFGVCKSLMTRALYSSYIIHPCFYIFSYIIHPCFFSYIIHPCFYIFSYIINPRFYIFSDSPSPSHPSVIPPLPSAHFLRRSEVASHRPCPFFVTPPLPRSSTLSLSAEYQYENAALALTLARYFAAACPPPPSSPGLDWGRQCAALKGANTPPAEGGFFGGGVEEEGLGGARWPGRAQTLERPRGSARILLDGEMMNRGPSHEKGIADLSGPPGIHVHSTHVDRLWMPRYSLGASRGCS